MTALEFSDYKKNVSMECGFQEQRCSKLDWVKVQVTDQLALSIAAVLADQ